MFIIIIIIFIVTIIILHFYLILKINHNIIITYNILILLQIIIPFYIFGDFVMFPANLTTKLNKIFKIYIYNRIVVICIIQLQTIVNIYVWHKIIPIDNFNINYILINIYYIQVMVLKSNIHITIVFYFTFAPFFTVSID